MTCLYVINNNTWCCNFCSPATFASYCSIHIGDCVEKNFLEQAYGNNSNSLVSPPYCLLERTQNLVSDLAFNIAVFVVPVMFIPFMSLRFFLFKVITIVFHCLSLLWHLRLFYLNLFPRIFIIFRVSFYLIYKLIWNYYINWYKLLFKLVARSLILLWTRILGPMVNDLGSETKGSHFEFGC